ncbi:MAG TPA: tRNA (adenosine(37)-N6)-dimethylallyltransferase MiaA [Gemmatimonadaceae bacterium]|nr:tRNA (adenosine(37)-N6)-dimethylallyltransferase MiaA [Gemmatimonadaceae bacterium]
MRSSADSADAEVRILCGPTAAGKSALAMALAGRFGAMIVSADSRQIYRGFDLGTAKPTPAERARVPHRGIDVADPTDRYSAAAWAHDAERWLAEGAAAGCPPVIVGGTGFYIRALTTPLFEEPALDLERRRALERELGAMPTPALRRWCERLDPARAELGRAQLLRALEVALLTGVPLSRWHAHAARAARVAGRFLLIDSGPALHAAIVARVHAMFNAGWPEEVAELARQLPDDAPAWNATGYAAVREYVRGRCSRADAIEEVVIRTRQYAKRQRTWFRHQLPLERVVLLDPTAADATRRAAAWWNATPTSASHGPWA